VRFAKILDDTKADNHAVDCGNDAALSNILPAKQIPRPIEIDPLLRSIFENFAANAILISDLIRYTVTSSGLENAREHDRYKNS
jgi:hypothetical protein